MQKQRIQENLPIHEVGDVADGAAKTRTNFSSNTKTLKKWLCQVCIYNGKTKKIEEKYVADFTDLYQ